MPDTPLQSPSLEIFDDQYQRVLEASECRTQAELAAVLGIRQSSISDAKRRKHIPAEWLIKLFTKKRINPEWIYTGLSDKFLPCAQCAEAKPSAIPNTREHRPERDCTTDALLTELVRRTLKNIE